MLTFISGGVRSGKSSFAEDLVLSFKTKSRSYLATAEVYDDEMRNRVKLHIANRKDKGFTTFEKTTSISEVRFNQNNTVLLDCLTNLVANEMYVNQLNSEEVTAKVVNDILELNARVENLVIVSNDIFSAIDQYSNSTMQYMRALGNIHCQITSFADQCYELNFNIATKMKG